MKTLFVIPSQKSVYGIKMRPAYPHYGALYVCAMLEKHHHDVEYVDMDIDGMSIGSLLDHIAQSGPQVIGLSCVTPIVREGFKIADAIKNRFSSIYIVMGGVHATIDPDNTIAKPGIDAVCIGEGEHTMRDLVDVLQHNGDMKSVKGIYFKNNGKVYKNPPREVEKNLDNLPFPAFHLIKDPGKYCPPDAQKLPAFPIITSRGCHGRCTYCCTKQILGQRFRMRSTENILEELDVFVNRYGAKEAHFLDDNLSANKKRFLGLCHDLKMRNYPLNFETSNGIRADSADEETLNALKDIGINNIGFGVESGNDDILKVIKKGITKDQVRKAMKLAKDLKFTTWGFFVIGFYKDTSKTIQDTLDFSIELDPDFAKYFILKPYPGSEIFEQLHGEGLIDSLDYSKYGLYTNPVHHLPDLSAHALIKWQKKAYRKFYLRPGKIFGLIVRIGSWTQLKLAVNGGWLVLSRILKSSKPQPAAAR